MMFKVKTTFCCSSYCKTSILYNFHYSPFPYDGNHYHLRRRPPSRPSIYTEGKGSAISD